MKFVLVLLSVFQLFVYTIARNLMKNDDEGVNVVPVKEGEICLKMGEKVENKCAPGLVCNIPEHSYSIDKTCNKPVAVFVVTLKKLGELCYNFGFVAEIKCDSGLRCATKAGSKGFDKYCQH